MTPTEMELKAAAKTGFGMDRREWRRISKQLPNYLFILPFLVAFLFFTVYPVLFGAWMSLHDWDIISKAPPMIGLANYEELLHDDLWWLTLRQTLQYALQTVLSVVSMGLVTALITFQDFRGRGWFRVIYYFPVTMSVAVVALAWQWLLNTDYGLVNYVLSLFGIGKVRWLQEPALMLPSLSIASLWGSFGFPMLIFLAGLTDIPPHLYDAAQVDGANGWQRFWKITLPLLRPTLLFVLVTQFISRLQEFGIPYTMVGITTQYTGASGFHHWTVIVYLFQVAWHWYRMGYGSALAFALAAVIVVITAILFRLLGRRLQY
ncbi:MAG TPA: sugar ABC transporter permease [Chloroflexi bacterium]|jgi:multiple sugar transport system permease protein|nr:sugar ABC transporter permease [Chloroflexota bacterium]